MDSVLNFIADFESRGEEVLIAHLICDSQGNIVDWILEEANPAALGMMKMSSFRGHRGRLGSDIIGRKDMSVFLSKLNEAKGQGKPVVFECRDPISDRVQVATFTIVGDDVVVVKKDITEKNQAKKPQSMI